METWTLFEHKFLVVKDGSPSAWAGELELANVVVWWSCGSSTFCGRALECVVSCPRVFCQVPSPRRTPKASEAVEWYSLLHQNTGGSTNARGVFALAGLEKLNLQADLPRTLAHIIKHSIRGKPCSIPLAAPHYTIGDRLSLSRLKQIVLFQSSFSHTGWVHRSLEPEELAAAFELPDFVKWSEGMSVEVLPLQLLRSVMETTLPQIRELAGVEPPAKRRKTLIPELNVSTLSQSASVDMHWLPLLGRWLPGTWTDTAIAARAVKSDNACIDFFPWNQRISLVLPWITPRSIQIMENWSHIRWCRALTKSFRQHLSRTYGSEWSQQLLEGRRAARGGGYSASAKRQKTSSNPLNRGVGGEGSGIEEKETGRSGLSIPVTELIRDADKGAHILAQVVYGSWWEWSTGSSPFFWRWNGTEQQSSTRDGIEIFVSGKLPNSHAKPARCASPTQMKLVAAKIDGMLHKRYLEEGVVRSNVHYFTVPKGEEDVRVVFDGTSSGLNEALWAPNFFLPSSRAASVLLTFSTWLADVDFGEMFHNFFVANRIRKYSGVDVSPLISALQTPLERDKRGARVVRWTRLFMGMRPSPYNAVRYYYWGEEFVRGDPRSAQNPMRYDRVRLNLPCMPEYDPLLPKVMKWNDLANEGRGAVSGDVVTFVDDVRISGFSKENCHEVHRRFSSRIQYLGMQDAPRKFRPPSQTQAGAWTGTIFRIDPDVISKSVSQEKWDRGRAIVLNLKEKCDGSSDGRPDLVRKELEKVTGFLNHLAMTFDDINPFLKGLYLTLNSWRPNRDGEDWKVTDKKWKRILLDRLERGEISNEEFDGKWTEEPGAPVLVRASPRMAMDVLALLAIMEPPVVPRVSIRLKTILSVVYGFGDASGTGLGATFTCGNGFNYRIGVWGTSEESESSNWKEFTNVVDSLEEEAEAGNLGDAEVFMFTDNSTVEACSQKGSSSSPKLLSLIIRLRSMATRHNVRVNVFHVAGTRMIAQGTDGVSRGYLGLGVMAGDSMSSFIPIHLSAPDRSPALVPWVRGWTSSDAMLLEPIGWFSEGHDISGWEMSEDGFERPSLKEGRIYIWAPPPFAADVALAELRKARIKRQASAHIFICPRLCAPLWLKQLYTAADIVFEVPPGRPGWSANMH